MRVATFRGLCCPYHPVYAYGHHHGLDHNHHYGLHYGHGQTWSNMVKHGHTWSYMVKHSQIRLDLHLYMVDGDLIMVKHGQVKYDIKT